jgi:putative addiction module antidote
LTGQSFIEGATMQVLKLRKIEDSLGLVFPKEILGQIGVNEGDSLFLVETPEGSFQLTPYDPEFERQMEIAEKGMSKYRNSLKILAQ